MKSRDNDVIIYIVLFFEGRRHLMEIRITEEYDNRTIKDWLYANGVSRALITRLKSLEDGICLNGSHATVRKLMRTGDILSLLISSETKGSDIPPVELGIDIIFENDELIALNKPPHMPTHPSHGHYDDTLANGLAYIYKERGEGFVFRAVNRLDRDTSGVVLTAKNQYAASQLCELMQSGRISKTYIALLNGELEPASGIIERPIRRAAGSVMLREVCEAAAPGARSALTRYETLGRLDTEALGKVSIVKAEPITGRTHQLRVHFASLGCPIVGDGLYGTAETEPTKADRAFDRHALHAARIVIDCDEPITIDAPLPKDMELLCRDVFEGALRR